MRLALVISSLALGGAQRAITTLAGGLAARGHAVDLLSFEPEPVRPFFPLHPAVRLRGLDLNRPARSALDGLRQNARRLGVLRAHIRELSPDAVLGFMDATGVLCILAALGTGAPVLACERTDPALCRIGPAWSALRRLAYPLAARVVAQTAAVAARLPGRVAVIPNPVAAQARLAAAPEGSADLPGQVLAGLGRLSPEKGFDMLLRAFARVAGQRPDWTLAVYGEGPLRARLEAQARDLGLEGRARFPGSIADPAEALRRADLFALPSRYEGFPNALLEALACGVPAVSFDCPSGPAEIIRHGVDGVLVPPGDEAALAEALARLMDDAALRGAMAARAPEVLTRFGLEKVLDMWEALLAEVTGVAEKQSKERG